MKRIIGTLLLLALAASCYKEIPPSDVTGSWQAIREEWVIDTDGKETTESFGSEAPADDFAVLELYHPSLYLFSSGYKSAAKSYQMLYSDRFSPLEAGSTKHTAVTLSVTLRKQKITGSGDAVWKVLSVDDERMEIDYDSGEIDVDGATVRRKCRFVFRKLGEGVTRN